MLLTRLSLLLVMNSNAIALVILSPIIGHHFTTFGMFVALGPIIICG